MPFVQRQKAVTAQGNGTISSGSLSVLQGSLLIVAGYDFNGGASSDTLGMSDTMGNVWTPLTQKSSAPGVGFVSIQQFWYAIAKSTGSTTITMTGSGTVLGFGFFEYRGNDTTAATVFDTSVAGNNTGASTTAITTGVAATVKVYDLLLCLCTDGGSSGAMTPGTNWTSELTDTTFNMLIESQTNVNAGNYLGTATDTASEQSWAAYLVAFSIPPDVAAATPVAISVVVG